MATQIITSGVQYSGIWTMQQVNAAVAAGTWPPFTYLYSWGNNGSGQLGLGNITYYSSPKQVGTSAAWDSITGGSSFTIATKTNGTLWSWGANNFGALGLGNTTYYSSPKQIGALTTWSNVATGFYYSIAIKTDGTIWTWGRNLEGQLGLGTTSYSVNSPTQVGSLTTWANIFPGGPGTSTRVQKTDGTLWAWGVNTSGSLGLGNTTNYSSPKQVGALTTWLNVAGGYNSALATKTDGTLWVWGLNSNGQLGLGNITNYSSPKQVGSLTTWSKVGCGSSTSLGIAKQ